MRARYAIASKPESVSAEHVKDLRTVNRQLEGCNRAYTWNDARSAVVVAAICDLARIAGSDDSRGRARVRGQALHAQCGNADRAKPITDQRAASVGRACLRRYSPGVGAAEEPEQPRARLARQQASRVFRCRRGPGGLDRLVAARHWHRAPRAGASLGSARKVDAWAATE